MSDVYEDLALMTPNSQKIYARNAKILAQEVVCALSGCPTRSMPPKQKDERC